MAGGKRGGVMECRCQECQKCCERTPGWLSPKDVRRLATHLGVTMRELFATHLCFDYWVGDHEMPETFVPSPATTQCAAGQTMPWSAPMAGNNRCLLFRRGLCSIHTAKPRECRATMGCQEEAISRTDNRWRRRIARAWNRPAARRFMETLRSAVSHD